MIAVAARAALLAPLGRVRSPALRIPPVRMDGHVAVDLSSLESEDDFSRKLLARIA